jgi:hypothetical protein
VKKPDTPGEYNEASAGIANVKRTPDVCSNRSSSSPSGPDGIEYWTRPDCPAVAEGEAPDDDCFANAAVAVEAIHVAPSTNNFAAPRRRRRRFLSVFLKVLFFTTRAPGFDSGR